MTPLLDRLRVLRAVLARPHRPSPAWLADLETAARGVEELIEDEFRTEVLRDEEGNVDGFAFSNWTPISVLEHEESATTPWFPSPAGWSWRCPGCGGDCWGLASGVFHCHGDSRGTLTEQTPGCGYSTTEPPPSEGH